jgi:hypothetical protein
LLTKGFHEVKLSELNEGMLFEYKGTIALKTEYKNTNGGCECYIIGTGEMFWGGTTNSVALNNLMVMPVWVKEQ